MPRRLIRLPFPVNGISRVMPDWAQPPLTCLDALNVRAKGAGANKLTGGERDGLDRCFENNAGASSSGAPGATITGGIVADRSSEAPITQPGNLRNFTDTFGDDYPKPNNFGGTFATGTNFLGRWVMFAQRDGEAFGRQLPATGIYPNTPYAPARSIDPRALGDELRFTASPVSANTAYGLLRAKNNTNRHALTLKILPAPFGRRAATSDTASGECTLIGPIVRVAADAAGTIAGFAHAYLQRVGLNQVRLAVDIYLAGTVTTYTSNRTYTLSGLPGPSEFVIEADATSGQSIRVRLEWSQESDGNTPINETFVLDANEMGANVFRITVSSIYGGLAAGQHATGATSGATARVVSWTNGTVKELVLIQMAGQFQNGETIDIRASAPSDPVLGSMTVSSAPLVYPCSRVGIFSKIKGAAAYRSIVKAEGSDIEPLPTQVMYSISGADADANAGLWQVKLGWDAIDLTTSAITYFSAANIAYSSGTNPATDAKPAWPCIDRAGSAERAGVEADRTITGGSAATAAAMVGSRINKTQFFIPSGHLDYETAANWLTATGYIAGDVVRATTGAANEGAIFECLIAHTSAPSSQPGIGSAWSGFWVERAGNYDLEIDLRNTDGTVDDSIGLVCNLNGFGGSITPSA